MNAAFLRQLLLCCICCSRAAEAVTVQSEWPDCISYGHPFSIRCAAIAETEVNVRSVFVGVERDSPDRPVSAWSCGSNLVPSDSKPFPDQMLMLSGKCEKMYSLQILRYKWSAEFVARVNGSADQALDTVRKLRCAADRDGTIATKASERDDIAKLSWCNVQSVTLSLNQSASTGLHLRPFQCVVRMLADDISIHKVYWYLDDDNFLTTSTTNSSVRSTYDATVVLWLENPFKLRVLRCALKFGPLNSTDLSSQPYSVLPTLTSIEPEVKIYPTTKNLADGSLDKGEGYLGVCDISSIGPFKAVRSMWFFEGEVIDGADVQENSRSFATSPSGGTATVQCRVEVTSPNMYGSAILLSAATLYDIDGPMPIARIEYGPWSEHELSARTIYCLLPESPFGRTITVSWYTPALLRSPSEAQLGELGRVGRLWYSPKTLRIERGNSSISCERNFPFYGFPKIKSVSLDGSPVDPTVSSEWPSCVVPSLPFSIKCSAWHMNYGRLFSIYLAEEQANDTVVKVLDCNSETESMTSNETSSKLLQVVQNKCYNALYSEVGMLTGGEAIFVIRLSVTKKSVASYLRGLVCAGDFRIRGRRANFTLLDSSVADVKLCNKPRVILWQGNVTGPRESRRLYCIIKQEPWDRPWTISWIVDENLTRTVRTSPGPVPELMERVHFQRSIFTVENLPEDGSELLVRCAAHVGPSTRTLLWSNIAKISSAAMPVNDVSLDEPPVSETEEMTDGTLSQPMSLDALVLTIVIVSIVLLLLVATGLWLRESAKRSVGPSSRSRSASRTAASKTGASKTSPRTSGHESKRTRSSHNRGSKASGKSSKKKSRSRSGVDKTAPKSAKKAAAAALAPQKQPLLPSSSDVRQLQQPIDSVISVSQAPPESILAAESTMAASSAAVETLLADEDQGDNAEATAKVLSKASVGTTATHPAGMSVMSAAVAETLATTASPPPQQGENRGGGAGRPNRKSELSVAQSDVRAAAGGGAKVATGRQKSRSRRSRPIGEGK